MADELATTETPFPIDTPREILQAFRNTLMALVEYQMEREDKDGECSQCTHKARTPLARFCEFCGKPLKRPPEAQSLIAAEHFRSWFRQEMHEFSDWEILSENGWNVSWLIDGGYVKLEGFDRYLEDWDPEDYEDNLGEGRSWWATVLHECSTGELKVDDEEGATP
jgi:hypothetical protein